MDSSVDFKDKNIVFFDGDCGVCNFWVQWILERDKNDKFMFASLQSKFGQKFLAERNLERKQFKTLYLWKPGKTYLVKSQAVLEIASLLGGVYSLAKIAKIFPTGFMNFFYNWVSDNRTKLATQTCFLPDAHQKKKFIEV
ncbi:thiol-disulfide oxidoreductase [Chryseobacterium sp. Leaf180]|uniref:thiol-disulfide oxidoreductase DCC family protein n=1 Tax=Chryseobacterium sp. Leaf180 TaxID=1736289 RepID=UPI0006F74E3A|nr:DUF393 domain-containing protein [Chryseobacterium sp. Leaf180]KQR94790.1 thiol-disulfide oxidoreductase [Chryseobacterium sp. Leaf180]